jgi:hypothetical protein
VLAIVSEHFEIDDPQLFAAKHPMALCYADTSVYPLRPRNMPLSNPFAGNIRHQIDQLIDRHHFL